MPRWLLLCAPLAACVTERAVVEQVLPSDDVKDVFCDIERGSFVYSGSSPDDFEVQVDSWATGTTKGRANARISTNRWGVTVEDTLLDLWGRSPASRAGVDLTIQGPPTLGIEAVLLDGTAQLYDVSGPHTITANRIVGRGVSGTLDLVATTDGIELEAHPEPGQTITIESWGPVTLALPYATEVDLEVFADPDWGADVTDLGFDSLVTSPDYVHAVSGSGAIPIHIVVLGGAFTLWNADL